MEDYNLFIEIIGAIIALAYLYFEYKASIWLWIVGIVMSLFYIYIFFVSSFYADAATYLYYLGANLYGLLVWKRNQFSDSNGQVVETPISHCNRRKLFELFAIFAVVWILIWLILSRFTDSTVPLGDAFTTALSIIAMWLLAKKHIEHWLLWIVINATSSALYVYKGLYPTAILFFIYAVGSVLGLLRWKSEMRKITQ